MNLSEIAISYRNCNGDVRKSFKEFLIEQNFTVDNLKDGIIIQKANNYVLRDIEHLLNKSILNIGASDLLLKKGYFHWGFVTSYYSNFFSIQALNRLKLYFNTWTNSGIECKVLNYSTQELQVKNSNNSGGSHESQFNRFYENYKNFRYTKPVDRYWTIGIQPFKIGIEAKLRNDINYHIEDYYFYELNISNMEFLKIITDNKLNPSVNKLTIKSPTNYSLPNLELAISRLRVALYILNFMANANFEYKSYFIKNNKLRLTNLQLKYPKISSWIMENMVQWLEFNEIETDSVVYA